MRMDRVGNVMLTADAVCYDPLESAAFVWSNVYSRSREALSQKVASEASQPQKCWCQWISIMLGKSLT